VVLLGDAAHAMTPNLGQGGAQAIEDAYALAEKLAAGPTPEEAFRQYQALRMPKVRWIVKTAWRLGQLSHWRSRWAQGLRDLVLRCLPRRMQEKQLERLYALDF
jgi:2-polyprenyl-6-methoxyphenol hydroxylase-like FAD-dependent oxidoreductase